MVKVLALTTPALIAHALIAEETPLLGDDAVSAFSHFAARIGEEC